MSEEIKSVFRDVTNAAVVGLVGAVIFLMVRVSVIEAQMEVVSKGESRLVSAVEDNTQAIQLLRIEMEKLLVIKPADVFKKLEQIERDLQQEGRVIP